MSVQKTNRFGKNRQLVKSCDVELPQGCLGPPLARHLSTSGTSLTKIATPASAELPMTRQLRATGSRINLAGGRLYWGSC